MGSVCGYGAGLALTTMMVGTGANNTGGTISDHSSGVPSDVWRAAIATETAMSTHGPWSSEVSKQSACSAPVDSAAKAVEW